MKIETREFRRVTKTQLISVLKDNLGKLATVTYKKLNGQIDRINGQYYNHVTELGWHQFKTMKDGIKQFDPKSLLEVKVNRIVYQLKK